MKVDFLKMFLKDIDKIKDSKDRNSIENAIEVVKAASTSKDIPGIEKLAGFEDAFRIRAGKLRNGVFIESDTVIFARVAHRKEIYRIFP